VTVQTFSGAHPFRPACLLSAYRESSDEEVDCTDEVAVLIERYIDRGLCPRCGRRYQEREMPAGSRVTSCRCIPVCRECGRAEALEGFALAEINGPEDSALLGMIGPVCEWPIDADEQTMAIAEFDLRHTSGAPFADVPVSDIQEREHPGGWLEHGHDDSADVEEQER
jgi:hypothetical protein